MRHLAPVLLLATADLQLRRGRLGEAKEALEQALAQDAGDPWDCWAELGLGWIRLAADENARAREHFARAESAPGDGGKLAGLMVALLDASEGRSSSAVPQLQTLAEDQMVSADLQRAARLGVGYAYYWSGRYSEAIAAFEAGAQALANSRLSDDARYGAALARYRAGDTDGAYAALDELATSKRKGRGGSRGGALVNLEPRAMLRAGFRAYRGSNTPLRPPEARVIELIDLDGVALARAALKRLSGRARPMEAALPGSARSATAPAGTSRLLHARGQDANPAPQAEEPRLSYVPEQANNGKSLWLVLLTMLVLLAIVARLHARRGAPNAGVSVTMHRINARMSSPTGARRGCREPARP